MTTEDIKQLIETMLKHMQIAYESVEVGDSDGRERFAVKTSDSHLLIGAKGANLSAFNHLVKKMVASKTPAEKVKAEGDEREKSFFIDVNGYQELALENIKNVAKIMGDRARSFKTSVELEPMSSYERMVVHSFFQDTKDIKTESVGDGEQRRVVIKYVEEQTLGN
ncbi:MAG: hypothetical protein EXS51_02335 [Candidatus Taylorbacteria bacterium]|nr:hypothetical protein [Candidatus Taylorbacteria bacterium]